MNNTGTRAVKAVMIAAPVAMALGATNPAAAAPAASSHPLALQIGLGMLTGNGGDVTNRNGLHAGASWAIGKNTDTPGAMESIDIDENYNSGKGGHINVVGVSIDERAPLQNGIAAGKPVPYAGLGIGVFSVQGTKKVTTTTTTPGNGSGNPGTTTTSTSNQSKTSTQIGGKIMLGVNFGEAFVEASYNITGSVNGVRTDSLNFSVGAHF